MNDEQPNVPYGFCHCGCGQKTSISPRTHRRYGHVKGEPVFYVLGHGCRKTEQYVEEDRGYTTPCWIFQLWRTHEGYGHLADGSGVQRLAHRVMWERANGPIPDGLHLDHLCREPSCVNPAHLEPVTPAENARRATGTKLNWDKVREIRRALSTGISQGVLAAHCGVSQPTISAIATQRNWRE